jgi:hypothetical protein
MKWIGRFTVARSEDAIALVKIGDGGRTWEQLNPVLADNGLTIKGIPLGLAWGFYA